MLRGRCGRTKLTCAACWYIWGQLKNLFSRGMPTRFLLVINNNQQSVHVSEQYMLENSGDLQLGPRKACSIARACAKPEERSEPTLKPGPWISRMEVRCLPANCVPHFRTWRGGISGHCGLGECSRLIKPGVRQGSLPIGCDAW